MTAGTHLAGAALTASLLRGMGVEVGLLEGVALAWGSVMPDLDTTTSGPGRFVRPLSSFLERRFGHRTLTHSLPFLLALALLLLPLHRANPSVYWAFLAGYLSHLLLDTLNVNGVPSSGPGGCSSGSLRRANGASATGAPRRLPWPLFLALFGFVLWPVSGQGFASAFRHLVGTPEVAVLDYLDWRDRWEVWAEVKGFNRETQEPVEGRFLVVEALGREGVLVEDELGRTLAVSRNGQVVAYRVRMVRGRPRSSGSGGWTSPGGSWATSSPPCPGGPAGLDHGGGPARHPSPAPRPPRGHLPPGGGLREPAPPPPARRPARGPGPPRRPLPPGGKRRGEGQLSPGEKEASLDLPALPQAPRVHPVVIPDLPSLSGLLVRPGDRVEEGEPLARYTDPAPWRTSRPRPRPSGRRPRDLRGKSAPWRSASGPSGRPWSGSGPGPGRSGTASATWSPRGPSPPSAWPRPRGASRRRRGGSGSSSWTTPPRGPAWRSRRGRPAPRRPAWTGGGSGRRSASWSAPPSPAGWPRSRCGTSRPRG